MSAYASISRQEVNELAQAVQLKLRNRVNLNELVIRPDVFNGYSPKPRKWIDCYEEAFTANDWTEQTAIK